MCGTWSAREIALFDAQHVADRRHGLDVVAYLRRAGVRDAYVLAAGLLHDCAKGDTGAGPRIAWSLGERLGPRSGGGAVVPGWRAPLSRLRDHAERPPSWWRVLGSGARAVALGGQQAPRDPEHGALFHAADEAS